MPGLTKSNIKTFKENLRNLVQKKIDETIAYKPFSQEMRDEIKTQIAQEFNQSILSKGDLEFNLSYNKLEQKFKLDKTSYYNPPRSAHDFLVLIDKQIDENIDEYNSSFKIKNIFKPVLKNKLFSSIKRIGSELIYSTVISGLYLGMSQLVMGFNIHKLRKAGNNQEADTLSLVAFGCEALVSILMLVFVLKQLPKNTFKHAMTENIGDNLLKLDQILTENVSLSDNRKNIETSSMNHSRVRKFVHKILVERADNSNDIIHFGV